MKATVKWAGAAVGVVLAAGVGWKVIQAVRHAPSMQLSAQATQALAGDGLTPVEHKLAPNFHLVDQYGHPVTMRQFHGKVVVLAFLDPVCWIDCPLEAAEMKEVDTLLGPTLAAHVELVAVDANPQYHTIQAVDSFTREHGMTGVSNWVYATSASLPALKAVWHKYYEYVNAPKFGMVEHTDNFWLISPQGREEYLTSPSPQIQYVGGTAQLLAAYVTKLLNGSVATQNASDTLGRFISRPIGLSYGLAADHSMIWSSYPSAGYTGVIAGRSAPGAVWGNVTPTGMTQRGGLTIDPVGSASAWTLIGPYGYQFAPMVRHTTTLGQQWSTPWPTPYPLAPEAVQPLAAQTLSTAWLVANHHLYRTTDGGRTWTVASRQAPWLAHMQVSVSAGRVAVSGIGAHNTAQVWTYDMVSHRWTAATFVGASAHGTIDLMGSVVWQSASRAGLSVTRATKSGITAAWYTTTSGGRTWRAASPSVAVVGRSTLVEDGTAVYALSATALGSVVRVWHPGAPAWNPVGSGLPNTGKSLTVTGNHFVVETRKSAHVQVWSMPIGGTHWTQLAVTAAPGLS